MAGHVTNPSTKFEDTTPIRSWVMRYNGSRWLPLRMRSRPLRKRRITWVGGQKQLHIWNPWLRFAYSLYNFHWAPTTIKSQLLSSRLMLKPGVHTIHIGFATAKRHFLARNRFVWSILRQNRCGSFPQAPPPKKKHSRVTLCRRARNYACAVQMWTKFCTVVGIPYTNLGDHRLRFFLGGGEISLFPLTCIVALTTLSPAFRGSTSTDTFLRHLKTHNFHSPLGAFLTIQDGGTIATTYNRKWNGSTGI